MVTAGWYRAIVVRMWAGLTGLLVVLGGMTALEAEADGFVVPAFDPAADMADMSRVALQAAVPAPRWTTYALTDALFWGRDNQAAARPLVVTLDAPTTAVISARDPSFPFSEGVRAFYGRRSPDEGGWEVGYWGVWGQSATAIATATPPNYLLMPEPLGGLLTNDGETATVKYNSLVNSAEANLFRTWTEWRDRAGAWLTVDWLAGFRYVGLEESSSVLLTCCVDDGVETPVRYGVRTRNNGFGAQIGNRCRWTWANWACEGWAKAGLLGTAQEQIQDPLVDYTGFLQRPALSSTGGQVSFIGDINTSIVYRLTDMWGIRVGYNLIWIDGLALAPNQFDFSVTEASGTRLVSGGGVFMHGANLGLEARW